MRMLRKITETKKGGYAILELLFYIALFAVLVLVVINSMITMTRSFKETAIEAQLVQSGSIMERMGREVRAAYGISSISASGLVLNTKDENGVNKTVEFLLNGTNVELKENSVFVGNLNTPNISISNLTFTQINTVMGKAIKISLTLGVNDDPSERMENFNDTVVLRGIY